MWIVISAVVVVRQPDAGDAPDGHAADLHLVAEHELAAVFEFEFVGGSAAAEEHDVGDGGNHHDERAGRQPAAHAPRRRGDRPRGRSPAGAPGRVAPGAAPEEVVAWWSPFSFTALGLDEEPTPVCAGPPALAPEPEEAVLVPGSGIAAADGLLDTFGSGISPSCEISCSHWLGVSGEPDTAAARAPREPPPSSPRRTRRGSGRGSRAASACCRSPDS